jgi:methionyl-tRNA formyltransferase
MKYIFFGSPHFAAAILEKLIEAGMPPVALVCNPDRPFGRKQVITPPPTKELVMQRAPATAILQPDKPSMIADTLRASGADLFVVAAYSQIIPESVLEIPRVGTLGTHPSLLPKYRGASPIQSVLLNGEKETGTTIYEMDAKMDHGPIIASQPCEINDDDTYLSLEEKLANLSVPLLVQAMPAFAAGQANLQEQDEAQATYTKKFLTEDAFIDENDLKAAENGDAEKAALIRRKINAFNPEPGAWTMRDGKRIKMLKAIVQNGKLVLTETRS